LSALGLCRFAVGVLSLRRVRRESVELADDGPRKLLDELCRQMGIRRPVDLRESPRLGVASTMGWRRPLVLLPAGWRTWPADQRRAALAHELAHVRLRHFPTWLGCQLSLVAHFYHPLVHWLCRRLRLEQEIAADALAAAAFADRRRYAAALAGLALQSSRPPYAIAPLGLFMSRPLLMRRIAMLRQTENSGNRPLTWRRHLLPLAIVAAAIAAAGLRASADAEAQAQLPGPTDPNHSSRALALLQVSRDWPMPLGRQEDGMTDAAWKLYCNSQLAFLRSDFLLQAALRDPAVAALPIIKEQARPIAWFQQNLQVGFVGDSELMYVMMHCRPTESDQAIRLIDAVVKAYKSEVLFRDDQRRLVTRDVLAKSFARLNQELEKKTQRYYDLATELGSAEAGDAQIEQQIQMKRLDRVENELMRLEGEVWQLRADAKAGDEKVVADRLELYAARLAELEKDREQLVDAIRKASQASVSLTVMRRELDQLQGIADDMAIKLDTMETDAFLPPRINQIHQALVTEIEPPR
jgi:hypothetical protein